MSAERDVSAPMIFTIGQSTRPLDVFIKLFQDPALATVCC